MTGAQAMTEQQRRASLEQQGRVGVGPRRGEADEGAAVTKELNKAQEAARKNVAGLAENLDTLNRKAGSSTTAVGGLNTALTSLFGGINESVGDKAIRGQKVAQQVIGTVGGGQSNTVRPGSALDIPYETSRSRLRGGDGRAFGSKDATGEWFENFGKGTPMTLHGKEAVVPENKTEEFIKDALATMSKNGQTPKMPDLKSMMPKMSDINPTAKMPDTSSIMEKLTGSIPQPKMPDIKGMVDGMMGQMHNQMKSMMGQIKQPEFPKLPIIPNVTEEARRRESAKTPEPTPTAARSTTEESTSTPTPPPASADATLNDVLTALNQLNKTMGQVAAHSEEIKDASSKTARLAGKATGNRALA